MNAETKDITKEINKEYRNFCDKKSNCRDCDFSDPLIGCDKNFFVDYMITKLKEHSNDNNGTN